MPTNRVEKRFSARTITGDIPRFWAAFEHLDDPEAKEAFENLYLSVGTPGLRDFTSLRIGTATALVEHVRSSRAYYTSIRAETLALSNDAEIFLPSARALVELYPEAMLPDVTFLIGRMSSGGTTSDAGILIGTELFTRAPHTPAHELDAWEQAVTRPATVLPYVVAHELIHVQQPQAVSLVLLAHCLREGSAEVLGEVISGGVINPEIQAYGRQHEQQLWERFYSEMGNESWAAWLYQGTEAQNEPADLGYFIGAQICRAYLDRAANQQRGVHDLINRAVLDPHGFLSDSGYAPGS